MSFMLVVCDLLVLTAFGRRLPVRDIVDTLMKTDDATSGHNSSESNLTYAFSHRSSGHEKLDQLDITTNVFPLLNRSSGYEKLDGLNTTTIPTQFVQLGFSMNTSSNHSSASFISAMAAVASKVYSTWDGSLNFKGVLLLLLFFCLGCITNVCLLAARDLEGQIPGQGRGGAPTSRNSSSSKSRDDTMTSAGSIASHNGEASDTPGSFVATGRLTGRLASRLTGSEKRGTETEDERRGGFGSLLKSIFSKTSSDRWAVS